MNFLERTKQVLIVSNTGLLGWLAWIDIDAGVTVTLLIIIVWGMVEIAKRITDED